MNKLKFLKAYLNGNTIILDQICTYPIEIKNLINSRISIVENYLIREKALYEIKKEQKHFGNSVGYNEFYEDFNSLITEIYDNLRDNEFYILLFHATRLLPEEVEDVKRNGLRVYNREEYLNIKLSILHKYGYTNDEIKRIWDKSLINEKDFEDKFFRENKVYFFYSLNELIDNSVYLANWGGEILHNLDMTKLNKKSAPYIIIKKIRLCELNNKFTIKEQIKALIISEFNFLPKNHDASYVSETNLKIDDIIETNETCSEFRACLKA